MYWIPDLALSKIIGKVLCLLKWAVVKGFTYTIILVTSMIDSLSLSIQLSPWLSTMNRCISFKLYICLSLLQVRPLHVLTSFEVHIFILHGLQCNLYVPVYWPSIIHEYTAKFVVLACCHRCHHCNKRSLVASKADLKLTFFTVDLFVYPSEANCC